MAVNLKLKELERKLDEADLKFTELVELTEDMYALLTQAKCLLVEAQFKEHQTWRLSLSDPPDILHCRG